MSKTARRKFNRKMELWIAQQGKCWLCGKPLEKPRMGMPVGAPPPDYPTIDHVEPVSLGGAKGPSNWMLAHFRCNFARGNRSEVRAIEAACS